MSATPEEDPRPAPMLQPVTFSDSTEDEQPAVADGYWACIAFMGHNEYTGYVTEIVRNGQPAYRVEMAEKLWGGDPLACVEYAATAWFSARPVTEAWVRKAYEKQVQRVAELARQEAEWQRAREQRALTAGEFRSHEGLGDDDDEGDPF